MNFARPICSPDLLGEINPVGRQAQISLKELFNELLEEQSETINVRLSNARVMQEAQLAFEFNNQIDPRKLRHALVARLTEMAEAQGYQSTPADIKRTTQLAVMPDKAKIKVLTSKNQIFSYITARLQAHMPKKFVNYEHNSSCYSR